MMGYKLELADKSIVELVGFSYPGHIVARCESVTSAAEIWDSMIGGNLNGASIIHDEEVIVVYSSARCDKMQAISDGDNHVMAHYFLDAEVVAPNDATSNDSEYIEAAKILLGMEE